MVFSNNFVFDDSVGWKRVLKRRRVLDRREDGEIEPRRESMRERKVERE